MNTTVLMNTCCSAVKYILYTTLLLLSVLIYFYYQHHIIQLNHYFSQTSLLLTNGSIVHGVQPQIHESEILTEFKSTENPTKLNHTVIILHGSGGDSLYFNLYFPFLKDIVNVIALSRPGYMRTPYRWKRYEEQVSWLKNVLDGFQLQRVSIIAISAGGPLGIEFAKLYPESVISLVLDSAAVGFFDANEGASKTAFEEDDEAFKEFYLKEREKGELPKVADPISMFTKLAMKIPQVGDFFMWIMNSIMDPIEILKLQLPHFITDENAISSCIQAIESSEEQKRIVANSYRNVFVSWKMNGFESQYQMLELPKWRRDLKDIKVPVLILHSRIDKALDFQKHALYAKYEIPNSEIFGYHGCGHLNVCGSDVEAREAKIREFLKRF